MKVGSDLIKIMYSLKVRLCRFVPMFLVKRDVTAILHLHDFYNVNKISIYVIKCPNQTTSLSNVEIPKRWVPNLNEEYTGQLIG